MMQLSSRHNDTTMMHKEDDAMTDVSRSVRSMKAEKRAKQVIALIHEGATWEDCKHATGMSMSTLRNDLIHHYAKSGGEKSGWDKSLFARQLKNADKRKNAEIHLVETGSILQRGMNELLKLTQNYPSMVAMPYFCERELENLAEKNLVAKDFLEAKNLDLSLILPCRENLYMSHAVFIPHRVVAIAATAVALSRANRRVVVHTNSGQIKQLLEAQSVKNITVDYVR